MSSQSLAQLRMEFKLDLILHALQAAGICLTDLPQLADDYGTDLCPVCRQDIRLHIDLVSEVYVRDCGCRPPVPIVTGISALMTPPESTTRTELPDAPQDTEPLRAPTSTGSSGPS